MARYLVTAMPFWGHVSPMSSIAAELVRRGHDVRMYTGSAFRERVERTGARFVPWQAAPDFDEQNLPATFPRLVGKKGLAQLLINVQDLFIATAPQQLVDARAQWNAEPWDVLVSEEVSLGPSVIAESIGCRWATVAILPLYLPGTQGPPPGFRFQPGHNALGRARDAALRALIPVVSAPLARVARRARSDAGLPPDKIAYAMQLWSRQLILASGVPSLDDNRTDRPKHLKWIGHLGPQTASEPQLPSWWSDLDGRRVIHVTQGTQNVNPEDLLHPASEGLADLDAIVVAVTGIPGQESLPFPVPANVRTASFIPYDRLLPKTDVVVTNGGWGGVLSSLSHGIPLVLAGGDLDKPEVARRVASARAGIDLRTGTPRASTVRKGVERILADDTYRENARRVASDLAAAGGAAAAAAALEQFVSTNDATHPR